jgi:hypothetical protein
MNKFRTAALGVAFGGLTGLAALAVAQTAPTLTIYHSGDTDPVVVQLSTVDGEELVIAADGSVTAYTPDSIVTTPPKDPPTCSSTSRNVQQGQSFSISLPTLCTDPLNMLDPASAEIVAQPGLGSVTDPTNAGTAFYEADADAAGPDSFTFRVADSDGAFSNVATVTINVTETSVVDPVDPVDPVPTVCSDRTNSLTASTRSGDWPVDWSNQSMPWINQSSFSNTRKQTLERNRYAAMAFNTGDFPADGSVYGDIVLEDTTAGSNAPRIVSLSPCPGDFTYEEPIACRIPRRSGENSITSPQIFWQIGGEPRNDGHCVLQPNTTYYFNEVHADNPQFPSNACPSNLCGFDMKVRRTQ